MNLYLVSIDRLGLYSVIARDKAQCKRLIDKESRKLDVRGVIYHLEGIDDAIREAQWFSLNTAVNWEAGIANFYQQINLVEFKQKQ